MQATYPPYPLAIHDLPFDWPESRLFATLDLCNPQPLAIPLSPSLLARIQRNNKPLVLDTPSQTLPTLSTPTLLVIQPLPPTPKDGNTSDTPAFAQNPTLSLTLYDLSPTGSSQGATVYASAFPAHLSIIPDQNDLLAEESPHPICLQYLLQVFSNLYRSHTLYHHLQLTLLQFPSRYGTLPTPTLPPLNPLPSRAGTVLLDIRFSADPEKFPSQDIELLNARPQLLLVQPRMPSIQSLAYSSHTPPYFAPCIHPHGLVPIYSHQNFIQLLNQNIQQYIQRLSNSSLSC